MISLILIVNSCSLFPKRTRERKIQSDIVSRISSKVKKLSRCSKSAKIFKHLNADRVRVVLYLSINSQGHIEKFKLDDKAYPEKFANCVFKVLDLISFPEIKNHEIIELEQPFIFSKK